MTYILGLKYRGFTSIISDSRITKPNYATNTCVKVGKLFPGCIFGISGDINSAREFIQKARAIVGCDQDIQVNWRRFLDFTSMYKPSITDHFKILLSSRDSGTPIIYLFDSKYGLRMVVENQGYFSIGSGSRLLDPFVDNLISMLDELIQQNIVGALFPYFFCLRLSELSLSFESEKLHKIGIGGVFHFLYQTSDNEDTQKPALYILISADENKKIIYSWYYRLLFVHNSIVIHIMKPSEQISISSNSEEYWEILVDTSSSPEYSLIDHIQFSEMKNNIIAESDLQPLYFFCGFGFVSPIHRTSLLFHATNEGKYVVNRETYPNGTTKSVSIDPKYLNAIIETIETSSNFDTIGPMTIIG